MTAFLVVVAALAIVAFVRVAVRVRREEEALMRRMDALMRELDNGAGR